jgi:hypothetical protein
MKRAGLFKILNIAAILLLTAATAMAAGTVTQSVTMVCEPMTTNCFKTLTFVCTADSADGTYPATAVSTANMDQLKGWYLMTGSWKNGSTYPTANSTLTFSTTNEGDILGGAGKGPTTAAASAVSKFTPITDTTYVTAGLVPMAATPTLQVTQAGTATHSAAVTLVFKFVK